MVKIKRAVLKTDEAKQLRVFRKAENLTQDELAKILNKTQATIQKYESGEILVPSEIVKKLHEKLQMHYDWWYEKTGPRKSVSTKKNLVRDINAMENDLALLNQKYNQLEALMKKLYRDFYAKQKGVK